LFSLFLSPRPDQEDRLIADLWEAGTAGIVEETSGVRAFFEDTSEAAVLIARFSEFSPQQRIEESTDWVRECQEAWPPMRLGRFFLTPPWCHDPTPPGLLRLEINPGMACGTGRHPATQLCLEAIEKYVKPGDTVLDVGSGSGILSSAARLVGAGIVVSCDIDPELRPMFIGSADAVRSNWADVIVANIDSATVEQLAPEFARVRKLESTLILSGFPADDMPEGLPRSRESLRRDEWVCLIC
jgi:ribosomal protein L11 methyltransferase